MYYLDHEINDTLKLFNSTTETSRHRHVFSIALATDSL